MNRPVPFATHAPAGPPGDARAVVFTPAAPRRVYVQVSDGTAVALNRAQRRMLARRRTKGRSR